MRLLSRCCWLRCYFLHVVTLHCIAALHPRLWCCDMRVEVVSVVLLGAHSRTSGSSSQHPRCYSQVSRLPLAAATFHPVTMQSSICPPSHSLHVEGGGMASFGVPVVDVIPSPILSFPNLSVTTAPTSTAPRSASILSSFNSNIADLSPSSLSKPLPVPIAPVVQRSMPSSLESKHEALDRWAFALADWVIPRWDHPIRDLDGWRTTSGMHGGFVRDCSLSVFVLLGASDEMPFTVYRELDNGNEETIEPAVSWMRDLRARRLLQSAVSGRPSPPVSPPPFI